MKKRGSSLKWLSPVAADAAEQEPADGLEGMSLARLHRTAYSSAGVTSMRWLRPFGQFGGLVKLGSGCCQAASSTTSIPFALYASSGVRPAKVE